MVIALLANVTLQPGMMTFGPVTLPTGLSIVQVAIDRHSLTSSDFRLDWLAEISRDTGVTWHGLAGAGTVGGGLSSESSFTVSIGDPADAGTRLRGSITSNTTVTTTITVRVT